MLRPCLIPLLLYSIWNEMSFNLYSIIALFCSQVLHKNYFIKATIHFCNGECIVHVGYSCWILYFLKRFTLAKIG